MKNDITQTKGKNRQKKEAIVAKLSGKVQKAKALIFTNYQGLTHIQLETLKKALKAVDAEFVVAKNTLLRIALENGKMKIEDEKSLEGQTGTLFAYSDPIAPLKELAKTIKSLHLPSIKFGIFPASPAGGENNIVSAEEVQKLFTLPPRDVLIAQFIGGLKSPLYGLHRALNWNLQKLVMTLKAIETKKA